jgi:hypothetical protein
LKKHLVANILSRVNKIEKKKFAGAVMSLFSFADSQF